MKTVESNKTGNKKFIPIGLDNFKNLIEGNYYFVDKSLFIQELLDSRAAVTLIPRPRRFGKTLNLSMLRYFFEKTQTSNRQLFNNLAIEQYPDYMEYQGNYPVIWLTFKNVKTSTWIRCFEKIRTIISMEFQRHYENIHPFLNELEDQQIKKIITEEASQSAYENALLKLSLYLERAYKTKVIILIDEYDSPIHAGYANGYYNEVITFMREFLGSGLKSNDSLEMSVLTGILRIAKESIFRGLNNLRICTLLDEAYTDKFGFLEDEVTHMFSYFGLENQINKIKQWYNGYTCGNRQVYNPWSIINAIDKKGILKPYWVNISENLLIHDLFKKSAPETQDTIEKLMRNNSISTLINEYITLPDIDRDKNTLLNFLLFAGYLTFEHYEIQERKQVAELKIPNQEVLSIYETIIVSWFKEQNIKTDYMHMLDQLAAGNASEFKRLFQTFSYQALSSFDITGHEPERFYHALTIGMFAALNQSHYVRSNRESGLGRYDVCLTPKDQSKPGIIIEFKKADQKKAKPCEALAERGETLEAVAQQALAQIKDRDYEAEMRTQGITHIIKLGIAFAGKECLVVIG